MQGPIPDTPQDPEAADAVIIQVTPVTGPQDEAEAMAIANGGSKPGDLIDVARGPQARVTFVIRGNAQ